MRKSRFSKEQIVKILKLHENGLKVAEICRQHGISEQTYYRWRKEYGGLQVGQAKRMKDMEAENRRLRKAVSDLTLDNQILKEVAEGKY